MDAALRACFHCGLPVPPGSRDTVAIDGEQRPMCCAGCAAAARLIVGGGLSAYYRHREQPPERPPEDIPAYAIYDMPEAAASFVAALDDGVSQAQLAIDGIRCAACTWLLERHIGAHPAVESISVSLAEGRAALRWRPAQAPLSELMSRIRALGFRPRPWQASLRQSVLAQENRALLRRLGVAGIVQMQIGMFALALYAGDFDSTEIVWRDWLRWASLVLCLPVMLYSCTPFFSGAWRGLRRGHPGMDVPVAAAILLAFVASVWFTVTGAGAVYYDSVAMFAFFLLLGRWLELRARELAGLAGGGLLALLPAAATRVLADGTTEQVPIARLLPGDRVLVRPGEAVPGDGIVQAGGGSVDEAGLSGESLPVAKHAGSPVSAGTLSVDGALTVEVHATGLQSRLGTILALADRAQLDKPRIVQLADRAAGVFVSVVLVLATGTGLWWWWHEPARALEIVLSVLVVSCPCALALATPAALTAATTRLRRAGFLVTRAHALDALAEASLALFDKTGTLTSAAPRLAELVPVAKLDAAGCLRLAASLEACSAHPVAAAFAAQPVAPVAGFRNFPGEGIAGAIDGVSYRLGRPEFAQPGCAPPSTGTWLLLADEHEALAWLRVADPLRADAMACVRDLAGLGLRVELLSGDGAAEVERAARELGATAWRGECSPEQKLDAVRSAQSAGERTLVVGDGINDVALLAGAGVSIAVANALDIARAAADCVILAGGLARIPEAIRVARRTRRIVHQNLAWACAYNLVAIPFAAAGLVPPWLAAIGMSASSLLVVANALRLRKDAGDASA